MTFGEGRGNAWREITRPCAAPQSWARTRSEPGTPHLQQATETNRDNAMRNRHTEEDQKVTISRTKIKHMPRGFTLELTHGGPAALPLLQALGGGALPTGDGERHVPVVAPGLDEIFGDVDIGESVHLLTASESEGRTAIANSATLQRVAGRTRFGRHVVGLEPGGYADIPSPGGRHSTAAGEPGSRAMG